MLKTRVFSAAATMALAAAAFAQPAATDLGTLTSASITTGTITGFTAGSVKWLKFTVPVGATLVGTGYLDIDTNGAISPNIAFSSADTHMGLYKSTGGATGTFLDSNDDSGPGNYSMLSYGKTTPSRPGLAQTGNATSVGSAHAGGSGAADITAGTYYLAVTGFGGNTYGTNYSVTSTHTATGDVNYRIEYVADSVPTNPTGVATNTPSSGLAGSSFTTTCTVTPGANPATTGHGVTVDTTAIGGGTVTLLDDGVAPDVTANDNTFTATLTVSGATTTGAKTLTYTITDAQARPGTTTSTFNVTLPPPANDACSAAINAFVGANAFNIVWATDDAGVTASCQTNSHKDVWYTFTPPTAGDYQFDTIGCGFDSVVSIYTGCGGTQIGCDDDTGGSLTSKAIVNGLAAGVPVTVRVAGYNTASGSGNLNINGLTPTAPTVVGSQTPAGPIAGTTVLLKATVTPGQYPVTTNHTVTVDMTSLIGGSSTQTFYDDGSNGDVTANDNVFSYNFNIDGSQGDGTYNCPVSINDAQGRPGSGNLSVVVIGAPQWDEIANGLVDAGNSVLTAQAPFGTGSLSNVGGHFAANEDVDMYRIQICDFANFTASTVHPVTNGQDTQLFLFDFMGNGVQMDDDNPLAGGGLSSQMGNQFVTANGDYYIAVSHYDVDPLNAAAAQIWEDQAFAVVRAPDGTTNGGDITLASWSGTYATAFDYRLVMTGVCFPCIADFNRDGVVDFFDYLDFVDALSSGGSAADVNLDGVIDFFDYLDFVDRLSSGC